MRKRLGWIVAGLLTTAIAAGCRAEDDGQGAGAASSFSGPSRDDERILIQIGIVTRADPARTHAGYQPLMDHLSRNTPYRVEFSRGRSTEETELRPGAADLAAYVETRLVEVAPLGVLGYLAAEDRFGAVPLVKRLNENGEPWEHVVFVVPSKSRLESIGELRGRRLAFGPSHATLSHLIARHELTRHGIEIEELSESANLASDEDVVDEVLDGRFDVGAVRDDVARRARGRGLRALHVSEPVPSRPLVIRGDLPRTVAEPLRDALLALEPEGASSRREWDELFRYGFAAAAPADYDPVRRILEASRRGCGGRCHETSLP